MSTGFCSCFLSYYLTILKHIYGIKGCIYFAIGKWGYIFLNVTFPWDNFLFFFFSCKVVCIYDWLFSHHMVVSIIKPVLMLITHIQMRGILNQFIILLRYYTRKRLYTFNVYNSMSLWIRTCVLVTQSWRLPLWHHGV